jgi:Ras-related GTP-binding protein C/D
LLHITLTTLSFIHEPAVLDQEHTSMEEEEHESLSKINPGARLTLERFLQDLPNADAPANPLPPKYHTGKIPNSKTGDGKPRLLLMGQRR